jgi:hypothetical protein
LFFFWPLTEWGGCCANSAAIPGGSFKLHDLANLPLSDATFHHLD